MSKELKAYNVVASNETENYINGETNLAFEAYDADDVDALLAENDKEIESLKASHYAEMVDAGMRERRLCRALWLARAERAKEMAKGYNAVVEWCSHSRWIEVERKCRAKAEQYK